MAAKRAALMDAMRAERGVAQPEKAANAKPEATDSKPEATKAENAPDAASPSQSAAASSDKPVPSNGAAASDPSSPHHAEWVAREQAVKAAESKVAEAKNATEARIAKAEADEAKAKQALTELAAAKDQPVEFLAKLGMTKEEWAHFMQMGGKLTPEAKKLKEMEARFNQLEAKHEAAVKKAEESARRASIESENLAFTQKLGSYALLSKIGGIQAVRNKQAQLHAQQGAQISLQAAADIVEAEMRDNLLPLLKHADVQRTLNLHIPDQPSGGDAKAKSPANGAATAQSTQTADPDEVPAPWDWAAKKRLARKRMDLERIKRSALS